MEDLLRIPIPVQDLREVLGDKMVDEALAYGAQIEGREPSSTAENVAGGFLCVDVTRRLRVADIYSRRLEVAVGLMGRDVRNQYEAAVSEMAAGVVRGAVRS